METNYLTSRAKAILLFLGVIIILVIGGVLTGIAAAMIGSLFYIVFLFPFVLGLAGGNTLRAGVRLAGIRKSNQMIFLSLLVAVSMYGTFHYVRYIYMQAQTYLELSSRSSQETGNISVEAAKVFLNYALEKETGHSGFVGFMLYKAQQGVSIGRFYSSNRLHLGPVLTWAYWLLEFGIILWVTVSMGRKEISIPVCDSCGRRYGKEKHLGGTSLDNKSTLLGLIERKEFPELGKYLEENVDVPSIELYLQSCTACEKGMSHLIVQRAFKSSKGSLQFADLLKVKLHPQEHNLLLQESRVE